MERAERSKKKQYKKVSTEEQKENHRSGHPEGLPRRFGSARAGDQGPHQQQGAAHHHEHQPRRALSRPHAA